MVKTPSSMVAYNKNADKAWEKHLNTRCKSCKRTMREGGTSGTPRICAKCMRGDPKEDIPVEPKLTEVKNEDTV